MTKKQETIFAEKVDKELKNYFGSNIEIFNIQQVTKIGDPDRLICLKGDFIGIEFKDEGGATATIQLIKLVRIKRAKGKAYVVKPSNWDKVFSELKRTYAS